MSNNNTLSSSLRGGWRLRSVMESKWLGGSFVAWAGLGLAIVGQAITFGATQASFQGQISSLQFQINRNREEALEAGKVLHASVANLTSTVTAMTAIKVDVEVIKSRILSTDDAMRRLESEVRSTNDWVRKIERGTRQLPR